MLIKDNDTIFTSENIFIYINAILEAMDASNIISINIQKINNRSYKYIRFKNKFLLELSYQIVR